ncbi:MAG: hypothetical protein LBG80_10255 [Bacteroidales bacterium]|jgi:hypothetical protein|nr:hypothetical protein [Bacteroidales bacterium]
MYKCRTCSKAIAPTAIICPHCGDADALHNKEINTLQTQFQKLEKKRKRWISLICFAIWLVVGFNGSGGGWIVLLWFISLPIGFLLAIAMFGKSSEMNSIQYNIRQFEKLRADLEIK